MKIGRSVGTHTFTKKNAGVPTSKSGPRFEVNNRAFENRITFFCEGLRKGRILFSVENSKSK
ncbi:hypothetical protein CH380_06140 [Leptospira adleri]|uniref:Uncharacterized protein n=1 Tax=Leptospira adleri TaxID=2023186 RepID=A0A2M9YRG8_9LEPT|nr:hypothetical protein CH380_06140 [Leptospira adleri]PJZ62732.1 hypothetical protein CH376_07065 [Leptospira adleri]